MAGRPSKLTPEVQQIIVDILRNCGTRTAAAGRSRVHMATFLDWMRRGEQATSGKFYDFLCAVKDAEAQAVLMATRTVHHSIIGGWFKVPARDKDGNYIFHRNPETGEILRDAQGRPEAKFVDEYREPSSADACWFLERRAREDFGGGGGERVTVNVNPPMARRDPGKKEMLNLFFMAVKILVDNGMKLPEPAMLEHHAQKAVEATAETAEALALSLNRVESMSERDLDDWFSHHAPQAGQAEKFEAIRTAGKSFAQVVCECTPPSAHQMAAVRKMCEAVYIANASMVGGDSGSLADEEVERS
jgi:hypothetical protein